MWIWKANNAKAVIVMVHGAGEHHGRYEWLRSQWLSKEFHIVMGDLPGQGATRKNRGHIQSFEEYITAIESWVDQAVQFELPVYLFGHSMGGLAVIRTVMEKQCPIKAILLSSPCLGIVQKPSKALNALSKVLNRVYPCLLLNSDQGHGSGTRSQQIRQRDAEDNLLVKKVSIRWYRELMAGIRIAHNSTDRFPDIPLLVVQAGQDLIVEKQRVREWFNKLPLTEKIYKEWPGLYHEVLNDPERDQVFNYIYHIVQLFEENAQKE